MLDDVPSDQDISIFVVGLIELVDQLEDIGDMVVHLGPVPELLHGQLLDVGLNVGHDHEVDEW